MSTNVAETSITIDDVTVVIDTGRVKEMQYDVASKTSRLVETWTSQDSSTQRRGRAGRVAAGACIRMYPADMFGMLNKHTLPEIKRTPLEQLCLQIKLLRLGGVKHFLSQVTPMFRSQHCAFGLSIWSLSCDCLSLCQAVEAPSEYSVDMAITRLRELGAFRLSTEGGVAVDVPDKGTDSDFSNGCNIVLTPLGHYLALLPMDVGLGKALLFSAILGCLDPVLTIVASLCNRSPLRAPHDMLDEARAQHAKFAWGRSDHLAIVKVLFVLVL